MVTDKLLTEVLRPKTLKYVAMPERVHKLLDDFEGNEISQNILLYSSSPGTGKTTITKILSAPYIENGNCKVINASKERGIDVIRQTILNFASTFSILGGANSKKLIVLEEMDGLTRESFDALRAIMEEQADNVRFIGNCNNISKIPEPIQSRFLCVPMYPISKKEEEDVMSQYVELTGIYLKKANINYTDETLHAFVAMSFPNMRNIINNIQGMITQKVTELDPSQFVKSFDCEDILAMTFDPSVTPVDMYKKVMTDYATNAEDAVKAISDNFVDYILEKYPNLAMFVGNLTITVARHVAWLSTVADKTIILRSLMCEMKLICQQNG